MLSYKPDAKQEGYLDGFAFDDFTKITAKKTLKADFARVISDSHAEGISFRDFATQYCNQTFANESLIAETLEELSREGEITILGPKGSPKRSDSVAANDIILPCNQLFFETWRTTGEK